jgi:hypothetical protein
MHIDLNIHPNFHDDAADVILIDLNVIFPM